MRAENHTPARTPLDAAGLRRAAVAPDGLWREIEVVPSTGSTNADLLARALRGEPEGVVLAAEEQTAGRGRMGRTWVSPPYAALTFSVLVRPDVPPARRGWLPLLTGVAVAAAVTERDRRPSQAEVAQRRPGRRGQARGHPRRGGRRRGRRRHRPQRVHRTRRATGPRPGRAARHVPARGRRDRPGPRGAAARDPGPVRALVPGLAAGRRRPGPQRAARRSTSGCPPRSAAPSGPNSPAVRCSPARPPASIRTAGCWSGSRRAPRSRWPPPTSSTCADAWPVRARGERERRGQAGDGHRGHQVAQVEVGDQRRHQQDRHRERPRQPGAADPPPGDHRRQRGRAGSPRAASPAGRRTAGSSPARRRTAAPRGSGAGCRPPL